MLPHLLLSLGQGRVLIRQTPLILIPKQPELPTSGERAESLDLPSLLLLAQLLFELLHTALKLEYLLLVLRGIALSSCRCRFRYRQSLLSIIALHRCLSARCNTEERADIPVVALQ